MAGVATFLGQSGACTAMTTWLAQDVLANVKLLVVSQGLHSEALGRCLLYVLLVDFEGQLGRESPIHFWGLSIIVFVHPPLKR